MMVHNSDSSSPVNIRKWQDEQGDVDWMRLALLLSAALVRRRLRKQCFVPC